MVNRVSSKDLEHAVSRVNNILADRGSSYRLHWNRRYNYNALDIGDAVDKHRVHETLITGCTKRELYDILWAIVKFSELIE